MDSSVTLWQFLLQLLLDPNKNQLICWTSEDGEFKLLQAEEVAKLWGARKNKPSMNYDKLSRALRYYYDKNIIKKVIGQKFVYRFVSYPDILSGDAFARVTKGSSPLSDNGHEHKDRDKDTGLWGEVGGAAGSALNKPPSRNDYLHSGLYTTFTLTSLQAGTQLFKSIKMENPGEKLADKKTAPEAQPSVIKYGTMPSQKKPITGSLEYVAPGFPEEERVAQSQSIEMAPPIADSVERPMLGFPLSGLTSHHTSDSPSPCVVPDSTPEPVINSNMESISSQPSELKPQTQQETVCQEVDKIGSSSGHSSRASCQTGKSKKPKGLELTPALIVTSSDLSPMNLSSPSLPTASLTPAFLQTPTLLFTPSPLLSNIHFWSTLSPVAPLSPARRQGTHTLFQFPSVINTQFQLPVHNFDGSSTPGPLSPDSEKT